MNKLVYNNKNGFTLIEVMIAMLILAIGILAVAKMQISAVKGNSAASGFTEATSFAQNKMEELVNLDYDDSGLNDTDDNGNDINNSGTNQDTNFNGIDDDDEGIAVDDIANFGLGDISTIANPNEADGFQQEIGATNIQYNISWNIAVGKPAANAKHIRVYVQWQVKGVTKTLSLDRIKANIGKD
jgi:type IV pilus assembly protein PilV